MRAVLYCRVSQDVEGRTSVEQQEAEGRKVVEREGWELGPIIRDKGIGASRHSKKVRPGFAELQRVLRAGDVLVVWEGSRVTRQGSEHYAFIDLCADKGVMLCLGGTVYDPTRTDDRMHLGVVNVFAAAEADRSRERILRGKAARRASGRHSGGVPPVGYRRIIDPETGRSPGWELDTEVADWIKEAGSRILAGESLWPVMRDLQRRGVKGAPDQTGRLRRLLLRPTYAGLLVHRGEIVGPTSAWPPIFTEEEHRRLVALLKDPKRPGTGPKPAHLLSGIAVCDVCGTGVRYARARGKSDGYVCPRGCVRRQAAPMDEMARLAVVRFFGDPRVRERLAESPEVVEDALEQARALRQELEGFYNLAAEGKLSPEGLVRVESGYLERIRQLEESVRVPDPLLDRMASGQPEALWESLTLDERRAVVRSVLEIRIEPARRGDRTFDPRSVRMTWRN